MQCLAAADPLVIPGLTRDPASALLSREGKTGSRVKPGMTVRTRDCTCGNAGAGEGNRTLVTCLGSKSSTIELHPRRRRTAMAGRGGQHVPPPCGEGERRAQRGPGSGLQRIRMRRDPHPARCASRPPARGRDPSPQPRQCGAQAFGLGAARGVVGAGFLHRLGLAFSTKPGELRRPESDAASFSAASTDLVRRARSAARSMTPSTFRNKDIPV